MEKIPLLVVAGPTASGKTDLAISLAKQIGGEIVSADSMQIYRGVNIGTAKPTQAEQQGIPHHMMDIADLSEEFSVALYVQNAKRIIADIHSRGKIPIVAGGTGLYINTLIDNIQLDDTDIDLERRQALFDYAEEHGNQALFARLYKADPSAAAELHPNNVKRVVRALELFEDTGKSRTEQQKISKSEPSPYRTLWLGLTFKSRAVLYARINERVDTMMESGLLEEAERFYRSNPCKTAAQAIGYKELKPFLDGDEPLSTSVEALKTETRRYAKRQLTWFRRNDKMKWLYVDEMDQDQLFAAAAALTDQFLKGEKPL